MRESSEVLVSREGAIVTLTINRPRAKNSLNRAVFDGLRAQLAHLRDEIGRDPSERRERGPAPAPRESFEDFADI